MTIVNIDFNSEKVRKPYYLVIIELRINKIKFYYQLEKASLRHKTAADCIIIKYRNGL